MTEQNVANPSEAGKLQAEAYDRFVDASPQGSIYCRTWWLDAVAPKQYEVLTLKAGDEIRAAWPITYQHVADQRIIGMPPLTQKIGILFAPSVAKYAERLSEEHRVAEEFIRQLPDRMYVTQQFHENFTNWLPFYWNGFQQTTRYTYLLPNLESPEAIWNAARNRARAAVRHGQKQGLTPRPTSDIERVFSLYGLTMTRQGLSPPYTVDQLERIDSACAKHAGRLALIAEDAQGKAHASLYLVYDSRCAIYLLGGADPDLRQSGAQTVLLWEAIQFASRTSRIFDFEGSMIRGVEAAIRDLGGVQTPYFKIWREADHNRAPTNSSPARRFAGRALRKLARLADPD